MEWLTQSALLWAHGARTSHIAWVKQSRCYNHQNPQTLIFIVHFAWLYLFRAVKYLCLSALFQLRDVPLQNLHLTALYSAPLHTESSISVLGAHLPAMRVLSWMGRLPQSAPLGARGAQKCPNVRVINQNMRVLHLACVPPAGGHSTPHMNVALPVFICFFLLSKTTAKSVTCCVLKQTPVYCTVTKQMRVIRSDADGHAFDQCHL